MQRRVRRAVVEHALDEQVQEALPLDDDTPDGAMEGETADEACDRILKKYADKATSPTKAIRAFCVNCMGGYVREVAKCTAPKCVLFPFKMGHNPFHGRSKNKEE